MPSSMLKFSFSFIACLAAIKAERGLFVIYVAI